MSSFDLFQYRPDIFRYVARLGIPKRMIEEVTQDVFLVAHTRRDSFRGQSTLRTWLFGIAFHLVRNWRRRRTNHEYCVNLCLGFDDPRLEDNWSQATSSGSAFDEVLTKELCAQVARVLDALPEVARRLWLMVTFEEAAVTSASKMLNLNKVVMTEIINRIEIF